MRWMGLDVGKKRIGVAVSDELGWTAQGVETIHRRDLSSDLERIKQLAETYAVTGIVVGLPKNMDGTIGPSGEDCRRFADKVEKELGLAVTMWDERLTTVAAERTLLDADMSRKKRKNVIDKVAAVMILQSFLDSRS